MLAKLRKINLVDRFLIVQYLTIGIEGNADIEYFNPHKWVINEWNGYNLSIEEALSSGHAFAQSWAVIDSRRVKKRIKNIKIKRSKHGALYSRVSVQLLFHHVSFVTHLTNISRLAIIVKIVILFVQNGQSLARVPSILCRNTNELFLHLSPDASYYFHSSPVPYH